jgi:hypothetical protein
MNSSRRNSVKKLACGFGVHLRDQMQVLDQMEQSISTMLVIGKKRLLPFQKGILTSIASAKGLLQEISLNGKEFLLTAHCNSDPTENSFSCLRTMGASNDHPGPVDCMNRIRLLVMCKDAKLVVENSAVEIEKSEESESTEVDLSTSVLSQSFPGTFSNDQ